MQASLPSTALNVACGQASHVQEPGGLSKLPAGQMHMAMDCETLPKVNASGGRSAQAWMLLAPTTAEYVSLGHAAQTPLEEKYPASQRHELMLLAARPSVGDIGG